MQIHRRTDAIGSAADLHKTDVAEEWFYGLRRHASEEVAMEADDCDSYEIALPRPHHYAVLGARSSRPPPSACLQRCRGRRSSRRSRCPACQALRLGFPYRLALRSREIRSEEGRYYDLLPFIVPIHDDEILRPEMRLREEPPHPALSFTFTLLPLVLSYDAVQDYLVLRVMK